MKFAVSYSGGKESALATYRAIKQGHAPVSLLTTYNTDANRSHFHGITESLLENVSEALNIPLLLVRTSGAEYQANFEKALQHMKDLGAEACVFGDIDIEGHLTWCSERCESVGLVPMFPLWGEDRKTVVYEFVDSGFIANISVINAKILSDDFLGQQLTRDVANRIAKQGADICGENGEYHTFVSAGPIFNRQVPFIFGEKVVIGDYAMLALEPG